MSSKSKTSDNENNPAIILAYGNHVTGIGLIRALGSEGLDVYLLDKQKYNLGKYSKYCNEFLMIPEDVKEDDFITFLKMIKKENHLKKPVLFPTNDYHVYILSKNKKRLEKNFHVAVSDWSITKKCYNKVLTYKLAKEIEIPIPRSFFLRDGISLKELDKEMEYPLIIKPGIMFKFYEQTGKKAFKVNNSKELKEKYDEACSVLDPKDLIIQEIIPGGPENLYSYGCLFLNGNEISYLIKKSRRQLPMDFGISTYLEKTDSPKVREMSKKILKKIDYNGMCEVEFKKDPRDGEFKFFEINPRPWKWHSLLMANGINMPYLWYRTLIGKKIKENYTDLKDIKWIDTYPDLYISVSEILKGRLSFLEYIRSMKNSKTFSVFSKDDLMPFVMETILMPYFYLNRK